MPADNTQKTNAKNYAEIIGILIKAKIVFG